MNILGTEIPLSTVGMSFKITFNSNGTWSGHATGDVPVNFGNGTYTHTAEKLIIYELGETYVLEIRSFTSNEIVFFSEDFGYTMTFVRI